MDMSLRTAIELVTANTRSVNGDPGMSPANAVKQVRETELQNLMLATNDWQTREAHKMVLSARNSEIEHLV